MKFNYVWQQRLENGIWTTYRLSNGNWGVDIDEEIMSILAAKIRVKIDKEILGSFNYNELLK